MKSEDHHVPWGTPGHWGWLWVDELCPLGLSSEPFLQVLVTNG